MIGKKRTRRRVGSLLLSLLVLVGMSGVPAATVYASSISLGGGKIVIKYFDSEVEYDGEIHYPNVTVEVLDDSVSYSASYLDPLTGSWTDTLPGYTEAGTYTVSFRYSSGGSNISGSVKLTITKPEQSFSHTPAEGVEYVTAEYEKNAYNSFDTLPSDKIYRIDCADYGIEIGSDEFYDIYVTMLKDCYSDNYDDTDCYNYKYPNHFFVDDIGYSKDATSTYVTSFNIKFASNVGSQEQMAARFNAINDTADDILSQFTIAAKQAEGANSKENYILAVHDGMCRELDFAYQDYMEGNGGEEQLHTAGGVLENRKGLCDGYALVFKYFMDRAQIPCRVVYSEQMNHCWNMVQTGGEWFHVDVSWDDLVTDTPYITGTFSNVAEQVTMYGDLNPDDNDIGWTAHTYFLKNDAEMGSYGYSGWKYYYPEDMENELSHPDLAANSDYFVNSGALDHTGAFSLIGNSWYSADDSGTSKTVTKWNALAKSNGVYDTETVTLPVNVRYLTTDGTYLLYTDGGTSLYRSTPDGQTTWSYTPATGSGQAAKITEFAFQGGKLCTVLDGGSIVLEAANADRIWTLYAGKPDDSSGADDTTTGDDTTTKPAEDDTEAGGGTTTKPAEDDTAAGDSTTTKPAQDDTEAGGGTTTKPAGDDTAAGVGTTTQPTGDDTGAGGGTTTQPTGDDTGAGGGTITKPAGDDTAAGGSTTTQSAGDGTEAGGSAEESDDASLTDEPEEGDEITVGDAVYEITEIEDGYEVAFVRLTNKKKTSYTILDTIKDGGITYKVTEISASAFSGNKKLKTIKIGKNVTVIGDYAFAKCSALKNVTIGARVTRIGENAFSKDKALQRIVIPSGVKKIEKNAFYHCTKLQTVQFKGKAPTIGKNVFKGIYTKAVFKVPSKEFKRYKQKLNSQTGVTKKMKISK